MQDPWQRKARPAQSAERKALNLVVVGSRTTWGHPDLHAVRRDICLALSELESGHEFPPFGLGNSTTVPPKIHMGKPGAKISTRCGRVSDTPLGMAESVGDSCLGG